MPTSLEWFQAIRDQTNATQRIPSSLDEIVATLDPTLRRKLDAGYEGLPGIVKVLKAIAADLAAGNLLLSTEGADSQLGVIAGRLAGEKESVAAALKLVVAALTTDPASAEVARRTADLTLKGLELDHQPGSLSPAEHRARSEKVKAEMAEKLAQMFGVSGDPGALEGAIQKLVQPIVSGAAKIASAALAPLQVPFREMLTAGINDLLASVTASVKAHPGDPVQVALDAILSAQRLGHAAHGLAIAAEAHPLFHALGFGQLAAAVVDLSGFAPLSQAALRPVIEAAIARPMRYTTNQQFTPYVPNENVLADHVRRRTLTLTDYDRWLSQLGYAETHRDRMIETVWRDPTVRDLALALEDAAVDEPWLLRRVRTAGYDDEDADQITRGLVQRANKASRERLRAQAAGAWAEGTISGEEYETLLADVGLSADAVRWERRAAELQRRRDAVKDALATYRTEYVNGTLSRDDYVLAITTLGVDPERQAAILADADARRAPRIQREEESAVKEALTELRRELVPRYRQLYTLGLVGAEEYQRTLEQAGITPSVAAQAVALDASRLRAAAAQTGSAAAERQLAETLRERQDLAIQSYRRGQLTDAQLAAALLAAGRPPDQVDVVVARERLARVPILARPPAIAAEAVDRLTPEFRRRAALEDYRAGRIDEDALYDELVAVGRTPEQADAEVGYELARRPPPKP